LKPEIFSAEGKRLRRQKVNTATQRFKIYKYFGTKYKSSGKFGKF